MNEVYITIWKPHVKRWLEKRSMPVTLENIKTYFKVMGLNPVRKQIRKLYQAVVKEAS